MSLTSLKSSFSYDLIGLACPSGSVSVGRDTGSVIRLDAADVPFLLSRRHAILTLGSEGEWGIRDCASTNGTYACHAGQPLRKLAPGDSWQLQVRGGERVRSSRGRGEGCEGRECNSSGCFAPRAADGPGAAPAPLLRAPLGRRTRRRPEQGMRAVAGRGRAGAAGRGPVDPRSRMAADRPTPCRPALCPPRYRTPNTPQPLPGPPVGTVWGRQGAHGPGQPVRPA